MTILYTGTTALDIGGSTFASIHGYDPLFSTESAGVTPIFNGGAKGFTCEHGPVASGVVWYHFRVQTSGYLSSASNDGHWFTLYDEASSPVGRIDILDGLYYVQVFGDTTELSPSFTLTENEVYLVDVKVEVGADVTMTLYLDGVESRSATAANTAARSAPVKMVMEHDDMVFTSGGDELYYSEIIITDNESTIGWRLTSMVPDADGTHTDWLGDYSALLDYGDGASISTDVAGEKESWSLSDYAGPSSVTSIRAVVNQVQALSGAESPVTQVTTFTRQDGVDTDVATAAANGKVLAAMDINPKTGLPWTLSDLVGIEMGVKATA